MLKTAFLVALVCIKRPADVCNMCIVEGYWQLSADGFCCQPLGYGKTEMHNPVPPMKIDPLTSDQLLCPVKHLIGLEKRLKSLRCADERRFWISAKKPYKAVTSRTMCTWLKEIIVKSGAAGSAKDVRSTAASTAFQSNIDMGQILEAANWQRTSTFARFYFKPQKLNSLSNILKMS